MFEGQLIGIYTSTIKGERLSATESIEAVAGRGLSGDRYFRNEGTFSKKDAPDREVTLIEGEAIDALASECEITISFGEARRNLVTRGVPLNHLVGKEFVVGDVVLRGIRLCEPCGHLEKLTIKGIEKGLCHRGGLRAQILQGGLLRVGDKIRLTTGAAVSA